MIVDHYSSFPLMKVPDICPLPQPMIHPSCQQDLIKMFPDRQQGIVLKAQMKKRIRYYEEHKDKFGKNTEWFELLDSGDTAKGVPSLYSMRFNHSKDLKNLRILFSVHEQKLLLIYAFKERSASDYHKPIEIARNRLKNSL